MGEGVFLIALEPGDGNGQPRDETTPVCDRAYD
jgi:hypothetical protein